MTTLPNGRTPVPIDQDGALAFDTPVAPKAIKPYPSRSFSTQVEIEGFAYTFTYHNLTLDDAVALAQEMKERGFKPAPIARSGFGGRPDNRVDPAYDEAGEEVCPTHRIKLREYTTQDGRKFKACPSKGTGAAGEKINQKGYCDLRFK